MKSAQNPLNLLLLSTSVGALGSGLGGGVELTLRNIALELMRRGHSIDILAPMGSDLPGLSIAQIGGKLHTTAQTQGRNAPIEMPGDSVLANMWEYARKNQKKYDLLVNFAYDWLPFYLTPFLKTPIAHLVSMGSLTLAMDAVIGKTAAQFPGTIGVHSRAQAETFEFADQCRCLGNGIDLEVYDFCAEPENYLGWVGRIAPEKGIEDAIAAADRLSIP
ncbi:MAG: UDP-glucose--tetrahydrobiopterin glucosyltransferase, partial [Cyanobacteria bacterium CAN_BIN43]|nr:UDP-glucose--tetrahydrobiopterin glucosyltransferase [Cyanobacteria bacterium CAN_BIN43]